MRSIESIVKAGRDSKEDLRHWAEQWADRPSLSFMRVVWEDADRALVETEGIASETELWIVVGWGADFLATDAAEIHAMSAALKARENGSPDAR